MPFAQSFMVWMAFLTSLGIDVRSLLNPPATNAQIAAAEALIGYRFPEDIRALYGMGDGQRDSVALAEQSPAGAVGPLFGQYEFVSLEQALELYRTWKEIWDEAGPEFATIYNWTHARAGDDVYPDYWRPGWFPFSHDGSGNSYAVDLSPPPGGIYGQIILIGRDEDERRVLAPSLGEFLRQAAARRPQIVQQEGAWISVDMEGGS